LAFASRPRGEEKKRVGGDAWGVLLRKTTTNGREGTKRKREGGKSPPQKQEETGLCLCRTREKKKR